MGYIFDALNKKRGDQPEGSSPDEQVAPEVTGPQLASIIASADQADDADHSPAPLRIADVQFEQEADNQQAISVFADAFQAADNPPAPVIEDDAEDAAQAIAAQPQARAINPPAKPSDANTNDQTDSSCDTAPLRIDANPAPPAKGWWSRLLGRHFRGKVDDRLVAMTMPASSMSEEYRSIRTSILARHDNERHLVHTISSATPQEGKTITCVNLGLSFAELRNRNTIIIECDLRLPTFAKLLNCDDSKPGLIDYLRGDASLTEVVQKIEGSPLHIIPAGGRVSDEAVQLLSSARMSRLIQALRTKYDHVLIDTPPVLQLADAGILGSQSEEVLLVARMRRTPRTLVEQAVNTLTSYNATVSGIIATDNPRSRGRGYGYKYGYGYGYGYSYTDDKRSKRKQRSAA